MLFCSPTQHGSCVDITHARQVGLIRLLEGGPAAEILADAGIFAYLTTRRKAHFMKARG